MLHDLRDVPVRQLFANETLTKEQLDAIFLRLQTGMRSRNGRPFFVMTKPLVPHVLVSFENNDMKVKQAYPA